MGGYRFAEVQPAYSMAPAKRVKEINDNEKVLRIPQAPGLEHILNPQSTGQRRLMIMKGYHTFPKI